MILNGAISQVDHRGDRRKLTQVSLVMHRRLPANWEGAWHDLHYLVNNTRDQASN